MLFKMQWGGIRVFGAGIFVWGLQWVRDQGPCVSHMRHRWAPMDSVGSAVPSVAAIWDMELSSRVVGVLAPQPQLHRTLHHRL